MFITGTINIKDLGETNPSTVKMQQSRNKDGYSCTHGNIFVSSKCKHPSEKRLSLENRTKEIDEINEIKKKNIYSLISRKIWAQRKVI